MSVLNSKSGLNRLFPFAKKKPNIPSKINDKIDAKFAKPKSNDDKIDQLFKVPEPIGHIILIENNENPQAAQVKEYTNVVPKSIPTKTEICSNVNDEPDNTLEDVKKPKENYQRWNIPFSSKFKGKEFDKNLLTMQDLIYYNPVTNPIVKETKVEQKEEEDLDNDLLSLTEMENKPSVSNSCITPCIKVGVDGKIIIDQETLTLSETGLEEKREELAKSKVIEVSGFQSRSYSYKRKREPSKQWNKDETLKFYKCLMNLGTDFSMIEQYFPGRTRAQIKRKYKTEEKKNPQLINGALTNSAQYDSVLIENMIQEVVPEVINSKPSSADEDLAKTKSRKRLHDNVTRAKCGRMSVCAYMMEEEIILKKKRNAPNKSMTASKLKEEVLQLQLLKKPKKTIKSKINKANENKNKEGSKGKNEEDKEFDITEENPSEVKPKVRTLQDFHEEYQDNITKFEDSDSN
ncbi:transcription factor TFIIIB component B'' homolog isoform X2 [Adelges cooleyi]|uniref:transcription factor TFIIIB component B'' homolog isoform X2 n=1 Tax=Adelges cooleyi TaxID=133065 RepID=UPI00218081B0|nr:transcription factor TFIIIB component B'' homolog isoform X2 [Adelges cooleyi]